MDADALIQEIAGRIYSEPFSNIREEEGYPNLSNPLHVTVLLIDCDTEITMNGMFGFLENRTGQHLEQTIQALNQIGAPTAATLFQSIADCMRKHDVTWRKLRGDFEGVKEFQVTSFREFHGDEFDAFADDVCKLSQGFSLFDSDQSGNNSYVALCDFLQSRLDQLNAEIEMRS